MLRDSCFRNTGDARRPHAAFDREGGGRETRARGDTGRPAAPEVPQAEGLQATSEQPVQEGQARPERQVGGPSEISVPLVHDIMAVEALWGLVEEEVEVPAAEEDTRIGGGSGRGRGPGGGAGGGREGVGAIQGRAELQTEEEEEQEKGALEEQQQGEEEEEGKEDKEEREEEEEQKPSEQEGRWVEEAQELQVKQQKKERVESGLRPCPSPLEALEALQIELQPVNKQASREHARLQLRMWQRRQRHLEQRSALIQGIRGFWAKAFVNHPQMSALISKPDESMLRHMTNLKVEEHKFPRECRKILLFFVKNSYFQNEVVTKEYVLGLAGYRASHSSPIQWHPRYRQEAYRRRHDNSSLNFFNWFSDHSFAGSSRIAEIIIEDLWPNPLPYFKMKEAPGERTERERGICTILRRV
ncbi:testis-specific Y-encoded protein 3-like [Neofelis nebulosa]|uniref:testis-specific Y-encoded protein 3-like n=1 Tax=Neofelis nebulosa TaxID=61452 RepID=UPI00272D4D94|nr:testis-specific Y-encoded protein 3-like [Neofelis nebulosa]XP_058570913.1 testis-specific Y-encoded protein 3-like [Neofelis nebulosa]XP_058570914.1 testis-specific Y-encoded protein 3-like [Neofelis nebulosa]